MSDADNHTTYSDPSTEVDEFYQTDFYSEAGEVEVARTKREREEQIDSGKHVIHRRRGNDKAFRVVVYSSGTTPGSLIRNAVNGARTNYRVGYAEEDMFFSCSFATGEVGQTTGLLFYDTPEQYEAHFRVSLSDEIKSRWLVKYNAARLSLEYFDRKTNTFSGENHQSANVEVR